MSAPALPKDNSLELQAQQFAEAERLRQEQAAADAQRKQELAQLRNNAYTGAQGNAANYFSEQGLVPGDYQSSIDSVINNILSGISPDDPNPGSYFNNVGQTVYNQAEAGGQNKALRDLDRLFAPNFAETRIPYTLDDPILASIEAEQYQSADDIIRNMLDRGVITSTGYSSAQENLNKQKPGVNARLSEIGTGQLASGQQGLRDIANNARQTASGLRLGTSFDPYSYSGQVDQSFTDFLTHLGDNIRAAAPGNLFSTAGLAAIAGAGQGAQNTAFDPNALAGIKTDEEDTARTNVGQIF